MSAPENLPAADNGLLRFLTCGSVDDGKSTLIGRLLLIAGAHRLFDAQARLGQLLLDPGQRQGQGGALPL